MEKEVRLNKDGKVIGLVLRDREKRIYYSHRTKEHFYRKAGGFGLQKAIIPKLFRWGILMVVLDYHGIKGRRLFVSHIGDWIASDIEIDYVKDRVEVGTIETYGQQKCIAKSEMKEIIY